MKSNLRLSPTKREAYAILEVDDFWMESCIRIENMKII